MSNAPVVPIDPQAFWGDPYPTLARMRAEAPICFVPELRATVLTRRDDVHTCEKNVAGRAPPGPDATASVAKSRRKS